MEGWEVVALSKEGLQNILSIGSCMGKVMFLSNANGPPNPTILEGKQKLRIFNCAGMVMVFEGLI